MYRRSHLRFCTILSFCQLRPWPYEKKRRKISWNIHHSFLSNQLFRHSEETHKSGFPFNIVSDRETQISEITINANDIYSFRPISNLNSARKYMETLWRYSSVRRRVLFTNNAGSGVLTFRGSRHFPARSNLGDVFG